MIIAHCGWLYITVWVAIITVGCNEGRVAGYNGSIMGVGCVWAQGREGACWDTVLDMRLMRSLSSWVSAFSFWFLSETYDRKIDMDIASHSIHTGQCVHANCKGP